jgi:hypothetical protein
MCQMRILRLRSGRVQGASCPRRPLSTSRTSSAHLAPPGEAFVAGARLRMLEDGERWCAIHAQPFCELRTEVNPENQGFRTFVPKRTGWRATRELRTVESSIFARYLFAVLDLERDR